MSQARPITPRPIASHGGFFAQADDGTVINPASLEQIPELVWPVVEAVREIYRRHLGSCLEAVYLRGSVVHGTAVEGLSDLDTFALIRPTVEEPFVWWHTPAWQAAEEAALLEHHRGWLTGIDFGYATWHDDFLQRNPTLAMTIKTQSVCVAGTDMAPRFPRYRPGPAMWSEHLGLERDIATLEAMASGACALDVMRARSAIKRMIRVAFELVMIREGRYTTSLYHCWDCVARHWPTRGAEVHELLEFYLDPRPDRTLIARFARQIGAWLTERVERDIRGSRRADGSSQMPTSMRSSTPNKPPIT